MNKNTTLSATEVKSISPWTEQYLMLYIII